MHFTQVLHKENGTCTLGEIFSQLSVSYMTMVMNTDQCQRHSSAASVTYLLIGWCGAHTRCSLSLGNSIRCSTASSMITRFISSRVTTGNKVTCTAMGKDATEHGQWRVFYVVLTLSAATIEGHLHYHIFWDMGDRNGREGRNSRESWGTFSIWIEISW